MQLGIFWERVRGKFGGVQEVVFVDRCIMRSLRVVLASIVVQETVG
jgi:hypothetical protein